MTPLEAVFHTSKKCIQIILGMSGVRVREGSRSPKSYSIHSISIASKQCIADYLNQRKNPCPFRLVKPCSASIKAITADTADMSP